MAAEKMIDADGLVLVGADGLTLVSDANDACGECCGTTDPCVKPADVTQCAALYVFDRADRMFWSLTRTCAMRMSASVSWASRGNTQEGDILGYRLYAPGAGLEETIALGPIFERDAGGCMRLRGFTGPARLWVFQAAAGNGDNTTRVLNVCVTARMTQSGWTIEVVFVDAADAGWVLTCTRPQAVWSLDSAGGVVQVSGTQHTSTLVYAGDAAGVNGGRAMLGEQVDGRLYLHADYQTLGTGPNEPGCPPADPGPYVIVVQPVFDTLQQRQLACQPGVVIVPGRFRLRLEARFRQLYTATSSTGSALNRSESDYLVFVEYRAPRTVNELDVTDLGSYRRTYEFISSGGTTDVTEQGVYWIIQTSNASGVMGRLFSGHVQTLAGVVAGDRGLAGYGLLNFNRVRAGIPSLDFMPCGGGVVEVDRYSDGSTDTRKWTWSGSNAMTQRSMSQTYTRDSTSASRTSHEEATLSATVSVEAIDVLVCEPANGGRALPAAPRWATLAQASDAVGRMLRGEM